MVSEKLDEKAIFNVARQLDSPDARLDYLRHVCGADADLLERVQALLRGYEEQASFLESPPAGSASPTIDQPVIEKPGTLIGPYKLLQEIGQGGMGVVYMAEQQEPVRRKVALKIIKPGMDTRQVIARFEAERQALAMMDHVNIARVLDVGATEAGRPYFVMELVHGVPITNYCDNNRLTPRERLELFVPVCQAIQHAHQKGIIHRDIKPSNVMVTLYDGKPVPKVIDFGVAKATEQKLTERTLFTQYGTMVGTLEYMSPEQAEMSALGADTRSDIYSLGVLLYELLTGSTPLSSKRMKEAAYAEVLRMIKEEEPPKPSTRLSESGEALASISAQRHMDPAKLSKSMRGELDWIVMKTLEKDRNRRYESASGFAADVQRYLNDEPVQACPPSAAYRFRKFARRNKRVLTTMTLLAVMLLAAVGTVAGSLGWVSRGRAARRLVVEQAVVQALEEGDQLQKQGKWQEALVAVERAQAALAGGEGGAEVQQQVSDQLADLHMIQRLEQLRIERGMNLLRHERYSQAYARAFTDFGIDVENLSPPEVAARIRRRPSTAVRVAAALDDWAIVLRDWGLHDRTRDPATWKRLLEAARLADPDPWRSQLRQSMGQVDLNALRKLADSSEITTLPVQSLQLMGTALIFGGDGPACVAWLRNAHRLHPGDALITFDLAYHLSNLPSAEWVEVLRFAEAGLAVRQSSGRYSFVGYALSKLGRHDEAIAHYRKAIELQPDYVYAHANLGIVLSGQGKLDEAIACYRKAIELDSKFTSAHANLGNALARQGKVDEAIASHKKAIELDPKLAAAHDNLGNALSDKGKLDDAIASYKKAIELDPKDAKPRYNLGNALMAQRKLDEAIATYKKAIELDPKFASPHINLGKALAMQGKLDESIVCYRKAIELNPKLATAHGNLGTAFANQGDLDEAIECYRKAIELDSNFVNAHGNLGTALYLQKKLDEAIACYRKAIELDPKFAAAHSNLGKAFADRGELDEAIASLKRAIELDPKGAGAHDNLGNALARQGKLDEAIASLKRAIELDPKFASPHNNLGFVFHQQRKLDEAIACYRKAIELDPILAAAHSNLGNAFADQGDLDEAIACYRKAIELDSNFVNAQFNLGVALNEQGKLDEAIACYRKALELNPKLATAHRNLGIALSEQGKLDEAIACYHTAIELDPKVAAVHRNLGFALFHQKKLDEAIASYRSAIALDPEDSSVQLNLGIALSEQGKVDEAIACFRKAVELDPKYAKAHHVLGIALYRQGEVDEAIACYGKAVELDPKNAAAHNGLAWLLATSAEPKFRDPERAVELAAKAGALDPKNSEYPSTLGAAHYRAGEWKAAITDLDKSMELREGGDANEWFFLAMAHWQLDEKEEARKWHDQAVAWMEKNKPEDDELKRFREEATELLGVKEK